MAESIAPLRALRRAGLTRSWLVWVNALVWLGAVVRVIALPDVSPRWDEGWSVAHASLPVGELLRITAADVHPPLYYLVLGAWQHLADVNLTGARYLSVLMSLPAIPLAFAAARAWSGSRRTGLFAAALMAWMPLAVYYAGVVRMYALAPTFVLLATYGALKMLKDEGGITKDEGGRRKDEGGTQKDEGGTRKYEGGRRKDEGGTRKDEGRFDLQPSTFNFQLSSLILHPSSFIPHPSSLILHPSSLILHPSSLILHPSSFILCVLGLLGAMLTLYHAAWSLLGLGVYVVGAGMARSSSPAARRGLRRFIFAVAAAMLLYLPWAAYAVPQLLARAEAESATNIGQQFSLAYFVELGVRELTMSQRVGWLGVGVMAVAVVVGLMCHWLDARSRAELHPRRTALILALPSLTIGLTLLGVAYAARSWAFNARMLVGAAPALAMLLAWSFDAVLGRSPFGGDIENEESCAVPFSSLRFVVAPVLAVTLFAVYAATLFDFVPRKSLEVFDPYNPHTYAQHLAPKGRAGDVAFFNVLSPAGFYALDRTDANPAWSYALTWDPVVEPRELWEQRIRAEAARRSRLWLVLYRGLAGRNGDLRGWMDSNFFPAASEWGEEDVFYGLYGAGQQPMSEAAGAGARWGDLELREVRLAPRVEAGDIVPVSLVWRANAPLTRDYKVFVHAFDANGALVAQHDAMPLNDLRPMTSWPVGELVRDQHGLALPENFRGAARIVLGVYDPATGRRIKSDDGRESLDVGEVQVASSR